MDPRAINENARRFSRFHCHRCGIVEGVNFEGPHRCNPTSVQMMRIGAENVEQIGRAIAAAFNVFSG